jgi:hypothetical protein
MAAEPHDSGHFSSERLDDIPSDQVDASVVLVQPSSSKTMSDGAPAHPGMTKLLPGDEALLDRGYPCDRPVSFADNVP